MVNKLLFFLPTEKFITVVNNVTDRVPHRECMDSPHFLQSNKLKNRIFEREATEPKRSQLLKERYI